MTHKWLDVEEAVLFLEYLPTLEPDQTHLLMLAARSRHVRSILGEKVHDIVLERRIIRPVEGDKDGWKAKYLGKLINLAHLMEQGRYTSTKDGKTIILPNAALAIYATLTPRSIPQATIDLTEHIIAALDKHDYRMLGRCDVDFFSALHRHRSPQGRRFATIDIDDASIAKDVYEAVVAEGFPVLFVSKTSRGYHIVIDITTCSAELAKRFYIGGGFWDTIQTKYPDKVELQRDPQEPVPGTHYYVEGEPADKPNMVKICGKPL